MAKKVSAPQNKTVSALEALIAAKRTEVTTKEVLVDDAREAKDKRAEALAEQIIKLLMAEPNMTVYSLLSLWQGALKGGAYHKTMARALLAHARLLKLPVIDPFDPAIAPAPAPKR